MSPPAKGPSKAAAGGSGVMAIESDLVRLIGALAARPAKLLRSGLPGKRDYRSFNKNLINPNEICDAKRMEDTGRLLFIYELAYRLDLLTERDGMVTCDLRAAEEFFAQDPTSRIRRMLSAYNGMVLWEEFSYTEGLLIVPEEGEPVNDDPVPSAARLVLARKLVIEALGKFARAKPRPFALRTVIGNIKKEGFRLVGADDDARRPPPKKGADDGAYRSIRVSGPLGAFRRAIWPGDWDLVEGALLETICRESLVWLGLAEQVDEKRFRLSPAGRTILGDGSDLPEEVTSKSLVVQPNFELLLFPEGRTPATMFAVERFARPGEEEGQVLTYRITRESVYGAVKDGMGIDQLLSFLEARASSALPQNVRRTLSTWASQFDRVVLMKGCLLVEGGTAKELDAQLKRLKGLRTERVTPTMVMVSPVDAAEAHKRLERKSCVVLDLSGPPPACITVSGELVIELSTELSDLTIHYTFDGSDPDAHYPKYEAPLTLPKNAPTLRVVTCRDGAALGRIITIPVAELGSRAEASSAHSTSQLGVWT